MLSSLTRLNFNFVPLTSFLCIGLYLIVLTHIFSKWFGLGFFFYLGDKGEHIYHVSFPTSGSAKLVLDCATVKIDYI